MPHDHDARVAIPQPTRFDATADHDQRLVSLHGELDYATAPVMLAAAADLVHQPGDLTLDFAGVTFISAAGLNATVRIREQQHARGSDVRLTGGSPAIRRVFVAGGLNGLVWTHLVAAPRKHPAMTVKSHDHLQLLETRAHSDRRTIESLQQALQTSRRIGAAVGVVMATLRLTEAGAFEVLQHASQYCNRKLRDIADDVVTTGVVPGQEDISPLTRGRRPASAGIPQAATTATTICT